MLNKKEKLKMWNIFEKKRLILTEWDNSPESKKNFKKAIKKLKAENVIQVPTCLTRACSISISALSSGSRAFAHVRVRAHPLDEAL